MTADELKPYFKFENGNLIFLLGESDVIECKQSLRIDANGSPRNFDDSIRAIAALANNKGGILLYGIAETTSDNGDKVWKAAGLANRDFMKIDPGNVSMRLGDSLMPFVNTELFSFEIHGRFFAGFIVEMASNKPVLSIKNTQRTREGCVYFRYPGQSKPIKYSELEKIIHSREAMQLDKLSKIFDTIVALSSDENLSDINEYLSDLPIKRAKKAKLLPEDLAVSSAKYINDGDKIPKNATFVVTEGVAVSDESIIENFIFQREVSDPLSYISHYCQIARGYLPIYYYLKLAGYNTPETRVQVMESLNIRMTGNVIGVVERVRESRGLSNNNVRPAIEYEEVLAEGTAIDFFAPDLDAIKALRALGRIYKTTSDRKTVFSSLESAWKYYKSNYDKRFFDALCHATCHIDYLFFE